MKPCSVVRLLAVGVVTALIAISAQGIELPVTGDAHVNSSQSVNFGALSNLYVGNNNTALLKFDLSSLPAGVTSGQIADARLVLFVNRVNTAGTVKVLPVSGGWNENSVTSVPALGASVATFSVSQTGQYVVIDLTSLVQSWIGNPGSNYGIALSSDGAYALFDSKENDQTAHAARLDVTITPVGLQGPAGATGATGATGAQGPIGPAGPAGASSAEAWNGSKTYGTGALVMQNGSLFVALQSSTGKEPGTDAAAGYWGMVYLGTGASPVGIPYTLVAQPLGTGDSMYLSLTGTVPYGDPVSSSVMAPTACTAKLKIYYFGDVGVDFTLVRINFSLLPTGHGDGSQNITPTIVPIVDPSIDPTQSAATCRVDGWSGGTASPTTCTISVPVTQGTVMALSAPGRNSTGLAYTAFSCQ